MNADNKPLSEQTCIPCRGGVPPLSATEQQSLIKQLQGWELVKNHHLKKNYKFKDFIEAMAWVNRLAELAEDQGHHPTIFINYSDVAVEIWTHKIDGLTESDFVLAAKTDLLN